MLLRAAVRLQLARRTGLVAHRTPLLNVRSSPLINSNFHTIASRAFAARPPKSSSFHPSKGSKGQKPPPGTPKKDVEPEAQEVESQPGDAEGGQSEIPLHDLTKGIPSTLEAELNKKAREQKAKAEEDGAEQEPETASAGGSGSRGGDKRMPDSAYETSADRKRKRLTAITLSLMGLWLVGGVVYFGRNWETADEEAAHPEAPSGWGLGLFVNRIRARTTSTMDYYNEPAFPKLLPDPDPAWERPYTLVLSLEDLLVHSEWTREHGWRMAKRPGVDYFLRYLSQYYELVIFTSLPSMTGAPVIQKLDPFRIVMWPLFREATRYRNGQYIKDLSYLNRDLSKVVLLDTDSSHAGMQPENSIVLPKWKGTPNDSSLVALIPFLEFVAAMGTSDIRKVLASFPKVDPIEGSESATMPAAGQGLPKEFARREADYRKRFLSRLEEEKAKRKGGSAFSSIGSALGFGGQSSGGSGIQDPDGGFTSIRDGVAQGKMLHDLIREQGQKQYEKLEKEIRENGEKFLAEIQAEEEKAREEQMKAMKGGLAGWFGSGEKK